MILGPKCLRDQHFPDRPMYKLVTSYNHYSDKGILLQQHAKLHSYQLKHNTQCSSNLHCSLLNQYMHVPHHRC